MAKRTRKAERTEDRERPATHAELGGARQTTESQAERNSINRQLAEEQDRRAHSNFTESTPSQTATSEELNDPDIKRSDAANAVAVAMRRAIKHDAVVATVLANQTPETLPHEVAMTRQRFDEQHDQKNQKRQKRGDAQRAAARAAEEDPLPPTRGSVPTVVTEGNVPQCSINSATTTVDPRTTTITNRRDGDAPTGETLLAQRSQSASGRLDFPPAHVPPDAVDRVRGARDEDNKRVLRGAMSPSIAGELHMPKHQHLARPLGETSLKEAQGISPITEHSTSGVAGIVPPYEIERHDAPTVNASGSKSFMAEDPVQLQQRFERERQEAIKSAEVQNEADRRKERAKKLKVRKPKGRPRAKGNKGKRKSKAGSKH